LQYGFILPGKVVVFHLEAVKMQQSIPQTRHHIRLTRRRSVVQFVFAAATLLQKFKALPSEEDVKAAFVAAESSGTASPDRVQSPIAAPTSNPGPRIAIASSGLGHIRRGIESWAEDVACALHRSGADVTLFQGGDGPAEPWRRTLSSLPRVGPANARLLSFTRRLGGWRYGLGSSYEIEQTTFAFSLWRRTRSYFDILHMQDPILAYWMDWLNRLGLSRPRVILGHGTEEPEEFLRKLSYLQHLTPGYRDDYEPRRPSTQLSFGIPNFIDTERFRPPADDAVRAAARAEFNLSPDSLVILCVAAIKKHHKRCDYLIQEFARFRTQLPEQFASKAILIIAGGREAETPDLVAMGKSVLGESLIILESVDRNRLAMLYRSADIFALASIHEMMPIALLEALASGLPATCNDTPTLRWMVGPAGHPEDISQPGGLVRQWSQLLDASVRLALSRKARAHVEATFTESIVVEQIKDMYRVVLEAKR
jgi:glycosyltransferase involved in cell wall biosynthesis